MPLYQPVEIMTTTSLAGKNNPYLAVLKQTPLEIERARTKFSKINCPGFPDYCLQ